MSRFLIPTALSSEIDNDGVERIHAAYADASMFQRTPYIPPPGTLLLAMSGGDSTTTGCIRLAQSPFTPFTWTETGASGYSSQALCVASNGSIHLVGGLFAALLTSTDMLTWTKTTLTGWSTTNVKGIIYGGGQFVAVGDSSNRAATSPDGITWTNTTNVMSSRAVTYGDSLYVSVGSSGKIATSPDGITWTLRTSPFGTSAVMSVSYGNGNFVAVALDGKLAVSTDAITWALKTTAVPSTSSFRGIAYGDGIWCATAADETNPSATGIGYVCTSTDNGTTWTTLEVDSGHNAEFSNVVYAKDRFLVVFAGDTTTYAYESTDGIEWIPAVAPTVSAEMNGGIYIPPQ